MGIPAHKNPLRASQLENLSYIFSESNWHDIMLALKKSSFLGAIVGPHGSGKTCLLEELKFKLLAQGFRIKLIRLTSVHTNISELQKDISDADIIMIDGAEQLSWWNWQLLRFRLRKKLGLIITTHKPGRLPTIHYCKTSLSLFRLIIEKLGLSEQLDNKELNRLFSRHNGNVRDALGELYIHLAQ